MKDIDPQKYSKSKTDSAGDILRNNGSLEEDKNNALEMLSNWRAAHSYPMHVFKIRLKRISEKIDKNSLSAQRLKRVPSIVKKLNRKFEGNKATMKLTQMQDIAGVRAVMSNVQLAKELSKEHYIKGDLKHKRVNEKDYITYPKKDGYRSIHLIYRFNSDKGKNIYNDLLVEVQIRSKLQHIWATAVETVGFFIGQAIKSNEGEEEWNTFFKLVSSAFAKLEGCPTIPNTPDDERELYHAIKQKEKELNIITKLKNWTDSVKYFEDLKNKKGSQLFLLELDTIQEKLTITAYSKRQEEKAIEDYAKAEKKIYGKSEYDVVLVGADTTINLKKAYPNYFLDTREFIKQLYKIINKY
ncbi:RelA/SpoT domain-containing protein [Candidatus Woesearchaeota archaeon]|nr:RelA/SpoT domain-containing protein [Candidatus Woesearchaeota archaeon]